MHLKKEKQTKGPLIFGCVGAAPNPKTKDSLIFKNLLKEIHIGRRKVSNLGTAMNSKKKNDL